ncbi:MAG: hypothetical protein U0807_18615 [Candidatus Binatia bacterium]
MVSTFALSIEPGIAPAASVARDRALLATPPARGTGALRVHAFAGDVLALGRWHRRPTGNDVTLHRRLTGGRVVAAGDGFVGLSLVLPHRAALVAEDWRALAPDQVMNRCVRGVLEGLKRLGVAAFYPGRDLITVERRPLGMVSFEVADGEAMLFEVVLSVARDMSVLPHLLDRADPTGVVTAPVLRPDDVTSLVRLLGAAPEVGEIARAIAAGCRIAFGVDIVPAPAAPLPRVLGSEWLDSRTPRADLPRHARVATMLGCLEAHVRLAGDGRLAAVQLAGDVIASSGTILGLERALVGCPATPGAVHQAVTQVLAAPERFVLGVDAPAVITDVVVQAAS